MAKITVLTITSSIHKAVEYLLGQQEKDGNFITLSSKNPNNFTGAFQFHSTFTTSLILSSLSEIEKSEKVSKIQKIAVSFLLSQKSKSNSFNYWTRESDEAQKMPYPDDLDDTSCAWSGLYLFDKSLIDGITLAKIVAILNLTEEKEGGPYKTWIVSDKADKVWRDVDIAVNSNVAYFLSLLEIDLPNVTNFINSCIEKNKLISPY